MHKGGMVVLPRLSVLLRGQTAQTFNPRVVCKLPDRSIQLAPAVLATKKSKLKKKMKESASPAKIDLRIGDGMFDLSSVQESMKSKVEKLSWDYKTKYPLMLSSEVIDNIVVESSGENVPLYQLAQVTSTHTEFLIKPMVEGKQVEKSILSAIQNSELNLSTNVSNGTIKIPIPVGQSDYRANILKLAKMNSEKTKVALRKVRQKADVDLRKVSAGKDLKRDIENTIQQLLDTHVNQLDKLLADKEKEIKQ